MELEMQIAAEAGLRTDWRASVDESCRDPSARLREEAEAVSFTRGLMNALIAGGLFWIGLIAAILF